MPVFIPIFILITAYPDGKFSMSTREHTDYQTCIRLNQYVISKIVKADQENISEIIIRIPDHSDDLRSLAYNEELGEKVADCLFAYDIITSKPKVITILDKNISDTLESILKEDAMPFLGE